jgi:hypothetical protein
VIKGIVTDAKYDINVDRICQLEKPLKNIDINELAGEIGIRKQKEKFMQLIEHHTKELAKEKYKTI